MSDPLSREQVREELKAYPNLEAIVIGCVSGQVSKWTMIRQELVKLVSAKRARIAALEHENNGLKSKPTCVLSESGYMCSHCAGRGNDGIV